MAHRDDEDRRRRQEYLRSEVASAAERLLAVEATLTDVLNRLSKLEAAAAKPVVGPRVMTWVGRRPLI